HGPHRRALCHQPSPAERRGRGERPGARLLHRQDLARALGREAQLREPRVSGPGGDRPRALGSRRLRTRDRVRVVRCWPLSHCGALLFAERTRPAGVSLSIIHLSLWGIFLDYSAKFPVESSPARVGPAGAGAPGGGVIAMAGFVAAVPGDRPPLFVAGDKTLLPRLARAREGRGFAVTTAESVADGLTQLETTSPAFAVVDMRLEDGNGLDVISALKRRRPDARAIILTGYGNIATAVNAVKLG